jgi:hypothetical protein
LKSRDLPHALVLKLPWKISAREALVWLHEQLDSENLDAALGRNGRCRVSITVASLTTSIAHKNSTRFPSFREVTQHHSLRRDQDLEKCEEST